MFFASDPRGARALPLHPLDTLVVFEFFICICKITFKPLENFAENLNFGKCLFVYIGRSVGGGGHMLVHEQLMDRSRLIQKYKSG